LEVSVDTIKELRRMTGAGILECKKALSETDGDLEKATALLRKRGIAIAEQKSSRSANEGRIDAYIHYGGRIGTLLELNCETDFVARTDEFKELAHLLAMQIAATSPKFIAKEDIPEEACVNPEEACLLLQPSIKDPGKTIQEVIEESIAHTGENIKVRRFARFELGY
jgi:elongation factor Ts